jgi:hypothetical protein
MPEVVIQSGLSAVKSLANHARTVNSVSERQKLMKTKLMTAACLTAITLCSVNTSRADEDNYSGAKTFQAAGDVIVARPLCFAATVVGSALFVVSLPVAAASKSVHKTAEALVLTPGRATFKRPIGEF